MVVSKHGLTLSTVKDLIRTSGTVILADNALHYTPTDFTSPRNVCSIAKDQVPMVVRLSEVSPLEVEIMQLVAARTSVRVPEVYAVFSEQPTERMTVTYIVEERLPGKNLRTALSTLDAAARETVTDELRTVFSELAILTPLSDRLGPFRGPWNNAFFRPLAHRIPCIDDTARDTESFLRYFVDVANTSTLTRGRVSDRSLEPFDLTRPPIFSHGDLHPANIMVHDGHISGIIDWAEAGWYPYFWDAYVLYKSVPREKKLNPLWEPIARELCDLSMVEARLMWSLQCSAEDAS